MTIIYDSITNCVTDENISTNIGLSASLSPTQSGVITGLQIVLSNPIGPSLNCFTLNLYVNDPLVPYPCPGNIVDTLLIIPDLAITNAIPMIYDFSNLLITNPFIMSGTRYWIGTFDDNSFVEWGFTKDSNGVGVNGEFFNNGDISLSTDNGTYQIKIDIVSM